MNNIPTIEAYGLDWHINKSKAFNDCLIDPIAPYVTVHFTPWDGVSLRGWKSHLEKGPFIFCQYPPPPELLSLKGLRLVWIPMWDYVHRFSQEWWNALPKRLRIVGFSEMVHRRAQKAGLPSLKLKFYKNPETFVRADWTSERILFYWDRIGLYSRRFLIRLCEALNIDKLLLQQNPDRGISSRGIVRLPTKFGRTTVEKLPDYVSLRERYLEMISHANVYLAPRELEGIGMAYLEAMARGATVLANDAPTMNEYITPGEDGYLFNSDKKMIYPERLLHLGDRLVGILLGRERTRLTKPLTEEQEWATIAGLDLQRIGSTALGHHREGFYRWQRSIPQLARFILDWESPFHNTNPQ